MKSQNSNSGGFQDTRTTRQRVAAGEVPKWLIDRWVAGGHDDPRPHYRKMAVVNVVCHLYIALIVTCAAIVLRSVILSRTAMPLVEILVLAVGMGVVIATTAGAMYLRGMVEDRMEKLTQPFDTMLQHLIRSPRPQFTPADLVTDHALLRSIEDALARLAALKTVFLEYEKTTYVGTRKLSDFAHEALGNLFDVGKELGVIGKNDNYTRFFQRATMFHVDEFRREFNKMLAALPKGELPPLFWYPDSN